MFLLDNLQYFSYLEKPQITMNFPEFISRYNLPLLD